MMTASQIPTPNSVKPLLVLGQPPGEAEAQDLGGIGMTARQHDTQAGHHGDQRRPAEPEQGLRRDMFADRRLQLGGDVGHDPDLDEVEIVQQADPEDTGHDVHPAQGGLPEDVTETARHLAEGEDHTQSQSEAQQDGGAKVRKQLAHGPPLPGRFVEPAP
jgi:hypothetical protein